MSSGSASETSWATTTAQLLLHLLDEVIGRIGTLFGEAGVNIANMAVSRTNRGDKALRAVSIDTPAPRERRGMTRDAMLCN